MLTSLKDAIMGLWLMFMNLKRLDSTVFAGKRVAIVGPADSVLKTKNGEFINGFDLVIRINKAPYQIKDNLHSEFIGTKTDILMHSFLENEKTGGGKLDFDLYQTLGIRYVVNPIPTYFGWRTIFNFYKKYKRPIPCYWARRNPYAEFVKHFGKYRPTTGFAGLILVLESDFKELFITGFTFFKTTYASGYRDHLIDVKANELHIKTENIHSPDIEFEQFLRSLFMKLNKSIKLDDTLQGIVENYQTQQNRKT